MSVAKTNKPIVRRESVKRALGATVIQSAHTVSETVSALRVGASIVKTALQGELLEMRVAQADELLELGMLTKQHADTIKASALNEYLN